MTVYRNMCVVRISDEETFFKKRACGNRYMSVTCIYESRIVFSSVTTEPKRFVLLIQVERVDKFFGVQHMRKIPLPFTVEG